MISNESLHDRAQSNFLAAKVNFNQRNLDEFFLNLTGYLLQQSVELELKHRLEIAGFKYPKSHDIEDLLDILFMKTNYSNKALRPYASELSKFESKTRYIKNYFLSERTLTLLFPIVENFIHENSEEQTHEF